MTTKHSAKEDDSRNIIFLPAIYNETLQLLLESYEYFSLYGAEDQNRAEGAEKALYSCEMSRITIRLSSIMAWLMVRKAVFSGKVSMKEAQEIYTLDSQDICLATNKEAETILPAFMTYLLDASLVLYERVMRLDKMPGDNPSSRLIH